MWFLGKQTPGTLLHNWCSVRFVCNQKKYKTWIRGSITPNSFYEAMFPRLKKTLLATNHAFDSSEQMLQPGSGQMPPLHYVKMGQTRNTWQETHEMRPTQSPEHNRTDQQRHHIKLS
jgi:hypothetical protein